MKHKPNKKVLFVIGQGVRYSTQKLTKGGMAKRKRRESLMHIIDCRVCCACKHAFISKAGTNICSDCYQAVHDAYRIHICAPPEFKYRVSLYRQWGYENGLIPDVDKTKTPSIPVPNLEAIKEQISATMDMMRLNIETDSWVVRSMPRVFGVPPYPHLERRRRATPRVP